MMHVGKVTVITRKFIISQKQRILKCVIPRTLQQPTNDFYLLNPFYPFIVTSNVLQSRPRLRYSSYEQSSLTRFSSFSLLKLIIQKHSF